MSKISTTYTYARQSPLVDSLAGSLSNNGKVERSVRPGTTDRVTLSEGGLAAAARFSILVERPANTYVPALPAPAILTEPAVPEKSTTATDTPTSRNLVRKTYEQQLAGASESTQSPGSGIDILI